MLPDPDQPPAPEPVHVTIMGATGSGESKVREIVTHDGQPNIIATFIPTTLAVIVRFLDTFLTILVAAVTAGSVTNLIPAKDFWELLLKCASLSVAGAIIGLLKDLIVIAGQLKKRFPLLDV